MHENLAARASIESVISKERSTSTGALLGLDLNFCERVIMKSRLCLDNEQEQRHNRKGRGQGFRSMPPVHVFSARKRSLSFLTCQNGLLYVCIAVDVQMLYFAPPMATLLSGPLNVATLGHDRGPISQPERGGNVLGLGCPPCPTLQTLIASDRTTFQIGNYRPCSHFKFFTW